jgi:allantoinase
MPRDLAIRSRLVVTEHGIQDSVVVIRGGRITDLLDPDAAGKIPGLFDVGDSYLLPGLVDTHVHVNEPGRTDWEGFVTATRAAAAGGVTTIVDMPLNSVPATVSEEALRPKLLAAAGRCAVDVGFWGGVVPGNAGALPGLAAAGVLGFKCFLVPSGVEEFPHVTEVDLRQAMPVIARLGLPLLVHAELSEPIERAAAAVTAADPRRYATWLASRPPAAELEAIRMMVRLCREFGCRVHIVHLATADGLAEIGAAREAGLPISVETCPHYLFFAAEEIADGATEHKCAPPIRERENRERLWRALESGEIDLVASDHSPCPPSMKRRETGDFMSAWGGIASLELMLPAMWRMAFDRGHTPLDLARWMSAGPARLAGLEGRKGKIAVGYDADLVMWDPAPDWTVEAHRLQQRHKLTPYADRKLAGTVQMTFVRGVKVYERGGFPERDAGTPLVPAFDYSGTANTRSRLTPPSG